MNLCEYKGIPKGKLFQKALPIERVKNPEKLFPMWASEKYDGIFCCAIKINGEVHIFSRTGEEYLSMDHLKPFFDRFIGTLQESVIFEAYILNSDLGVISGACRDTKAQHPELIAMMHTGVCDNKRMLTNCYPPRLGKNQMDDNVYFIHHTKANSLEEAMEIAKEVWARGGEGVILNAIDNEYKPGMRDLSMIKIKEKVTYDLEVVGVNKGKGKFTNMVGAIFCRWKTGNINVSGMTDLQRKEWWVNPNKIIGQIVEIEAMKPSSKGKLREPRFKGIRYDKDCADF